MSRQTRKRRSRVVATDSVAAPSARMTEADYARARARFGCLRSRGTAIGFGAMGPRVDASTPNQLTQATERALISVTEDQDAS